MLYVCMNCGDGGAGGGMFRRSIFSIRIQIQMANERRMEGRREGGRSGERANAAVIYAATELTAAAAMNSNADDGGGGGDASQVISFSPFYLSGLTAVRLAKVGKLRYA